MPKQLQASASSADSTLRAAVRRRFRFSAAPSSTGAARFAVSMLFTVDGFAFGMWAGHIAAIRAALDLSPAALSLALFGLFTGAIASMPLTGALSRRFPSRRLSIAGAVLSLPALALPGIAGSLGALVAAAIAFGASRGVLEVAMNTVASELQERAGRPIFSSFHACFSFGGMAGAGAASLALGLGGSPPVDLPAAALLLLALVAPTFRWLPPSHRRDAQAENAARSTAAAPVRAVVPVVRRRLVVFALGGAAFCGLVGEGAAADWSGVYLRTVFDTLPFIAPLGYTSFSLAMAVGRVVGDRIQSAVPSAKLLRLCGLSALLATTLVVAAPNAWCAIAGFALLGASLANVIPILFGAAGRLGAGSAIATVSTIGYAGFILGPPLIGAIAQARGLRLGLSSLIGFCIGMLLFGAIIRRDDEATKRDQACAT